MGEAKPGDQKRKLSIANTTLQPSENKSSLRVVVALDSPANAWLRVGLALHRVTCLSRSREPFR